MLRQNKTISLTVKAIALTLLGALCVQAQDCSDGVCRIRTPQSEAQFQPGVGQARYSYPSYSQERFPEFEHLRGTTPRYRDVQTRDMQPFQSQRDFLARDDFRSTRDSEWQRYHENWDARQRRQNYDRPSRSRDQQPRDRGDYFYSGFDYDNSVPRRPVEDRYRFPIGNSRQTAPGRSGRSGDRFNGLDRDSFPLGNGVREWERSRQRERVPQLQRVPQDRYESPRVDSNEPTLDQKVTARYSDAKVVRFAGSLTGNQGLALFREVSSLIDQRHLSPKSYRDRVGEGLRNLQVAMQNRTFRAAFPVSQQQQERFRTELGQLASRSVRNQSEAEGFVRTVMQTATQAGMRPGLVAYEFANASIQSLDKFSSFDPSITRVSGHVDETNTRTAQSSLDEYVTGVGVEVRHHAQGLEIVRALRGGPAVQAGVESGDIIQAIDGREIGGMEMNTSTNLISGQIGTPVRFKVLRESRGTKTFTLVRRRFRVFTVNDVKMVDRQTGYMHLNKFARSSTSEMEQAIQELRSQGMRNLIVDVRGNPGGLLTTSIEISDKFLKCGRIVATRGRLASDNMVETASATGTWSMPLVVLVDKDSASASEIFAAAIQENGRGLVVGERSYGKGTVQTHFPLSSGLGTVKLTTAKFYSPMDREMSGAGVTPDVRSSGEKDAMSRALTAASHPRLAEMVAQHGTCRPAGQSFGSFGSAAKPVNDLSVVLGN